MFDSENIEEAVVGFVFDDFDMNTVVVREEMTADGMILSFGTNSTETKWTQEHVREMLPLLQHFAETGELPRPGAALKTEGRGLPVDMDAGRRGRVVRPKIDKVNLHLARAAGAVVAVQTQEAVVESLAALEALSSLVQEVVQWSVDES